MQVHMGYPIAVNIYAALAHDSTQSWPSILIMRQPAPLVSLAEVRLARPATPSLTHPLTDSLADEFLHSLHTCHLLEALCLHPTHFSIRLQLMYQI